VEVCGPYITGADDHRSRRASKQAQPNTAPSCTAHGAWFRSIYVDFLSPSGNIQLQDTWRIAVSEFTPVSFWFSHFRFSVSACWILSWLSRDSRLCINDGLPLATFYQLLCFLLSKYLVASPTLLRHARWYLPISFGCIGDYWYVSCVYSYHLLYCQQLSCFSQAAACRHLVTS